MEWTQASDQNQQNSIHLWGLWVGQLGRKGPLFAVFTGAVISQPGSVATEVGSLLQNDQQHRGVGSRVQSGVCWLEYMPLPRV